MSNTLSGTWYNQLGSVMILNVQNGALSGTYESTVGSASGPYILTGRYDTAPPSGRGVSVGWVVTFQNQERNAHSTTTWSGQYFNAGGERILTHWLLTSSTLPKDVWKSTNLGTDTFIRTRPSPAEIATARSLTVCSPDPEDILAMMNLTPDPWFAY